VTRWDIAGVIAAATLGAIIGSVLIGIDAASRLLERRSPLGDW
jgi:hypothetical protein